MTVSTVSTLPLSVTEAFAKVTSHSGKNIVASLSSALEAGNFTEAYTMITDAFAHAAKEHPLTDAHRNDAITLTGAVSAFAMNKAKQAVDLVPVPTPPRGH